MQAIIFVHTSSFIPKYLLRSLESARVFNPEMPILLITDLPSSAFKHLNVETISLDLLETEGHKEFLRIYTHFSKNKVKHERFCFSRWFYINECIRQRKITQCVHLDSDCMLFSPIVSFFDRFGSSNMAVSREGSPHCSFITGSLDKLTDLIVASFKNPEFFGWVKAERLNLSDMTLITEYIEKYDGGIVYTDMPLGGIIDCNINCSDGFQMRFNRKRVYWKNEEGMRIPYLKCIDDGSLQRALALHYQGGHSKRWSSRFNRYSHTKWPMFLRKTIAIPVTLFYNIFQSHRLKPFR